MGYEELWAEPKWLSIKDLEWIVVMFWTWKVKRQQCLYSSSTRNNSLFFEQVKQNEWYPSTNKNTNTKVKVIWCLFIMDCVYKFLFCWVIPWIAWCFMHFDHFHVAPLRRSFVFMPVYSSSSLVECFVRHCKSWQSEGLEFCIPSFSFFSLHSEREMLSNNF